MSKIKELLNQAYNQFDDYNKGGATSIAFFGRQWAILRTQLMIWRISNEQRKNKISY